MGAAEGQTMDWSQELGVIVNYNGKPNVWNFFDDRFKGNLEFLGGSFWLINYRFSGKKKWRGARRWM